MMIRSYVLSYNSTKRPSITLAAKARKKKYIFSAVRLKRNIIMRATGNTTLKPATKQQKRGPSDRAFFFLLLIEEL